MRRVRQPHFLEYFTSSAKKIDSLEPHLPNFIRHSRAITPLSVFSTFIAVCFVGGLFNTMSLCIGISLTAFLGFIYLQTRSIATNLYIKRRLSKTTCFEFDEIEVTYKIINASLLSTPQLQLKDHFSASSDQIISIQVPTLIKPASHRTFQYRRKADAGMGRKKVGPISISFTDFFGFFQFEIIEDEVLELEVLPKVEELPDLSLRGSSNTFDYGTYNLDSRGSSVNFSGVREFVPGDSLRHIAWKASAKRGELMVKEFEKIANAEMAIFLNLNPSLHLGTMSSSTWELVKDTVLSIASHQVRNSNAVSFYTQSLMLEPFRGETGIHLLARQLIDLSPENLNNNVEELQWEGGSTRSSTALIDTYFPLLSPRCNVVLITPFVTEESESIYESLKSLKSQNINVLCVLVDTASYFSFFTKKFKFLLKFQAPAIVGIEKLKDKLLVLGIDVVILSPNGSIQKSFLDQRTVA